MRTIRSKLAPRQRRRANGTIVWVAQGWVPVRHADGTISRRRTEHRLGGDTAQARAKETEALNTLYEDRAAHAPLSFATAYQNYVDAGHTEPLYGETLVVELGQMQARAINDTVINAVRRRMFKDAAAPSYVNRHLHTPVSAILRMALKSEAPVLTRPKGHKDSPPISIPDQDWYGRLSPHLGPDTLALLALLTVHGRRIADCLGRVPRDFDAGAETLTVGRTKTGEPLLIDLHPGVADLIRAMPGWEARRWLFRDGPNASNNVRKDILAACLKAVGRDPGMISAPGGAQRARETCAALGMPYFGPHALGRHMFATRLLRAGYSVQHVMIAGGWKSIDMVVRRYGHLARSEVTRAVHETGSGVVAQICVKSTTNPTALAAPDPPE